MEKGQLSHLARPGARIALRVTPRAGRNTIEQTGDMLHLRVTTAPEGGKANKAVTRLLARALGVAPSRLTLVSGAKSRDKVFRLD